MGYLLAILAASAMVSGPAIVVDGDTLRIQGERVRIAGIDAPERAQWCGRRQRVPCGRLAAQWMEHRVEGRIVRCSPSGRDQYGRLLATCRVDGTDIGSAAVEAGWAIAYRRYSTAYVLPESRARRAGRGLWALGFQTPEAYRRTHRR